MATQVVSALVPLDESNWRFALPIRVTDDQLPLVADHQPVALVILAKAYVQPGGLEWEPLAFVDADGAFVAVLALAHDERTSEVRNLAVDHRHQGRGVGRQVMAAVLEWCRARGSDSVHLTFHPSNERAQRLYDHAGLEPTGETRNGEPVWSVVLG